MNRCSRQARQLIMAGVALVVGACASDTPTTATPTGASALSPRISDGASGGTPKGFYWLAPSVKPAPSTFPGTFDADLAPSIAICPITSDALNGAAACTGPVVRTLSGTSQPEIIKVDAVNQNYSVNWTSTGGTGIVTGNKYRAITRVGTRVLGWVDLAAVTKQRDVASVPKGYVGFVVGSPFLFKFRIETKIPGAVAVTPTPVTMKDNAVQDFTAVVTDLHGAVLPGAAVSWTIAAPAIGALAPASGTTNTSGSITTTLTPVKGVGGTTTVSAGSEGAVGTADVTVQRAVGSITLAPKDPTIADNATQEFTATVLDLVDKPLPGVTVTWSIDKTTVAALSSGSGTSDAAGTAKSTATPAGTLGAAVVTASADGKSATSTLTVVASCTAASPDTDGDRLPDCYETNTKVFKNITDTGTDPNKADTDGDNISDGDEVLGTTLGLDLPGMGVSPLRRDILLEYDWFTDARDGCGAHSHRPTAASITRLTAAFSGASTVINPDGSTGVHVINDYGQGGLFTGGTAVADADGIINGNVEGTEFLGIKGGNFAANRAGYFHYVLLPHQYNTNSFSSGYAEFNGDDMIVSLQCYNYDDYIANTVMHELGHNLGLRHGGFEDLNYKPNYNSVMNYKFQFPGIDTNCDAVGDGVLGYSVGTRITLNEANLDERAGVCGAPYAIDWNGSGFINTGIGWNLNPEWDNVASIMKDYNDWLNLDLGGIGDADGSVNPLVGGVPVAQSPGGARVKKVKQGIRCREVPPRGRRS